MAVLAETVGLRGGFWFYLGLAIVLVALSGALIRMTSRADTSGKNAARSL